MKIILFIIFCFAFALSPVFRCAVLNPIKTIKNGAVDLFFYFKYKKWHNAPVGNLVVYTGLFGRGKTLSAVHRIVGIYNQYNDKIVWDSARKKYVTQKIFVLSNVVLSIPYEKLVSLDQIVAYPESFRKMDLENDTLTITYILGDEFSVQMNSRNFKTNIDPMFLNTLLTCRHWNIGEFILTSQRFAHMDALMRQVTQTVIECRKVWRFQVLLFFDAWELENCTNIDLVKPLRRSAWFVTNKDYAAYDTKAVVDNLTKSWKAGDMLSQEEILQLMSPNPDPDSVVHTSKKARRRKFNK